MKHLMSLLVTVLWQECKVVVAAEYLGSQTVLAFRGGIVIGRCVCV